MSPAVRRRSPCRPRFGIASHIVSEQRPGEPETNRALFDLLARGGWLPVPLTDTLHKMAGFPNVVVHGCQALDKGVLADVVRNRLDDLLAFVAAIRARLPAAP